MDIGGLYAEGRRRITELVAPLARDDAASPVPTCPGWTVADVVAHLAGTCADIVAGNLDGVTSETWTEAQVAARRDRALADVVAEWQEVAPQVEALSAHFPRRMGEQWITDLTTHEHDVRTALGRPGARDSAGVDVALDFLVTAGLGRSISGHGLPPLEVRAGDRSWTVGGQDEDGDAAAPACSVAAPPFELLRALTGRRSQAQVRALDWSTDPEPYLPAFTFGPFRPAERDVVE